MAKPTKNPKTDQPVKPVKAWSAVVGSPENKLLCMWAESAEVAVDVNMEGYGDDGKWFEIIPVLIVPDDGTYEIVPVTKKTTKKVGKS